MAKVWGSEVRMSTYGGHPGLVYDRGPSTFEDLVAGTLVWTDRAFLVHGERRVTFAAFRAAAGAARAHLDGLGIRAGDRVMVFGYNSPEWVVALWALWLAGAVPVLANRWWSPAEIDHAVGLLAPRHVLADTPLSVAAPTSPLGDLRAAFDAMGDVDLPGVSTDGDDPALILFTSGSSGMPKAVELSRRSVICNQHDIMSRTGRLLSCGHCVASITSAVSSLPGVTGVDVALAAGTVRVDGTPDVGTVAAAIEDAGYDVAAAPPNDTAQSA